MAQQYLHGFEQEEQSRLRFQADFLAPWVHRGASFISDAQVLELGCGVGAQTPHLIARGATRLTCVDRSPAQLASARAGLADERRAQLTFLEADATALPLADGSHAAAFVCWLLEHVESPRAVLAELHRVLAPGARVELHEVWNGTATSHPRFQPFEAWWAAVADVQRKIGGDAEVGIRLGALLSEAGFAEVDARPNWILADGRHPLRDEIADYFFDVMRSATSALQTHLGESQTASLVEEFESAVRAWHADPERIWSYAFVTATAVRGSGPWSR